MRECNGQGTSSMDATVARCCMAVLVRKQCNAAAYLPQCRRLWLHTWLRERWLERVSERELFQISKISYARLAGNIFLWCKCSRILRVRLTNWICTFWLEIIHENNHFSADSRRMETAWNPIWSNVDPTSLEWCLESRWLSTIVSTVHILKMRSNNRCLTQWKHKHCN